MRLPGNIDCGCDNRRDIMFTQGDASWSEVALIVAGVALVLLAYHINRRS